MLLISFNYLYATSGWIVPGVPRLRPLRDHLARPLVILAGVLMLLAGCSTPQAPVAAGGQGPTTWEVHFSPHGGCTQAVVEALEQARKTVLVQAYSFTSSDIAKALVDAHKRGVDVRVILDKSQVTAKYSSADFLAHMGIPTWIDSEHAIAHNKVMVIDGSTVITGSFNFTKAAEEKNAENLLILHDKSLASRYADNWQAHREHSEAYEGK